MSSSVLHLLNVDREAALPALDTVLSAAGFECRGVVPVARGGPYSTRDHEDAAKSGPNYILSPRTGRWLSVIEGHSFIDGAPELITVAKQLSKSLGGTSLALSEHDGGVFMYSLFRDGERVDEYNSNPMHMRQRHQFELTIEQLRHAPEAFDGLLTDGHTLAGLRQLLDRGWWAAHDAGRLDEHGIPQDCRSGHGDESQRMVAFGDALGLYPLIKRYPFAAWGDAPGIDWPSFVEVRYAARPRK